MHLLDVAHPELALLAVVVVLGTVATLAQRSRLPYPVYLVLFGVILAFVPRVPRIEVEPKLIFLVFLPPLVYAAAYFASLRELRRFARSVSLLAIGLVVVTMGSVACVAHALVGGMSWPVAFVLGAIVSPTDTVAASAVLEKLRVPRRVQHITEGESLLNDGTGLVLFNVAVAAVVSGSFSAGTAAGLFVANIVGGVLVGAVVGMAMTQLRRFNTHGPTDVLLSLLSGYAAYLPAESLHVSGVLSTAVASIWLGWRTPTIVRDPETRLQIDAVWVNVSYMINTVLFLLVGMQLPGIVDRLHGSDLATAIGDAVAVGLVVIVTRFLWAYPATYVPRWLSRRIREQEQPPDPRNVTLVAWIGMRGSVTLAAALAVPKVVDAGGPFPMRDMIVFIAFTTILMTLVLQGLTLPLAIRWLKPPRDDSFERSEAFARQQAAEAALAALDGVQGESWVRADSLGRLRSLYEYRLRGLEARLDDAADHTPWEQRQRDWKRLVTVAHEAERTTLLALRRAGEVSDDVVSSVQRGLDLEDARLRG